MKNNRFRKLVVVWLTALLAALVLSGMAYAEGEQTDWATVQAWLDSAEEGAVFTLPDNITAGDDDAALVVPEGKNVTIDLNGYSLNRGLTYDANGNGSEANGNVITVNGALTLKDSAGGGEVTGGVNRNHGGGIVINSGAVFNLESGSITGNVAAAYGSSVYCGGGIYLNGGALHMSGGSITGNTTRGGGGGVYIQRGTISIEGSPVISDNIYRSSLSSQGVPDNLPADTGEISVTGDLDGNASIGVHPAYATAVNTQGKSIVLTSGLSEKGALDNFTSDYSSDRLAINEDGELIIGRRPYVVHYTAGDGASGSMADSAAIDGEIITLPESGFTPEEGKQFEWWKIEATGDTKDPGQTITVSRAVTTQVDEYNYRIDLTAVYVDSEHTVTWKDQDGTDIDTSTVAHRAKPTRDSEDPTKDPDVQYTYTFAGWASEEDQESGADITDLPEVTADIAYYAAYSKTVNQYEVSFDTTWAQGASDVDPITADYGSTIEPPEAPTATDGLTFGEWCKDEACTTPWDFDNDKVEGDMTLYAKWVHIHDGITFQPWLSEDLLPDTAGNYYLENDVTITAKWQVPGTTKLCLKGHNITKTGTNERVIVVDSGASALHIYDETDEGKIQGGRGRYYGGGIYVASGKALYLHGGCITDNTAEEGGGVYVDGRFYMYGGSISGNTAYKSISSLSGAGGGVYAAGNNAYFEMHGGTIENNSAQYGGGVRKAYNKMYIYGGSIINNKAAVRAGGIEGYDPVYFGGTNGTMSTITITGNTAGGKANNLITMNGTASSYAIGLHILSDLTDDSRIGLSSKVEENTPEAGKGVVLTTGLDTHEGAAAFFSDTEFDKSSFPYRLTTNDDGELVLVAAYAITLDPGEGSGSADDVIVNDGETYKLPANPFDEPDYKSFAGWKVGSDETIRQPDYEFEPTANTTVTAQWAYRRWTVSFDADGGGGEMDPETVNEGPYTLPDNDFDSPDDDHLFKEWEVTVGSADPVNRKPGDEITVTADTAVIAVWSEYWTVTFDPAGKGTGEMDPVKVIKGDSMKLPDNGFTPIAYQSFSSWLADGQSRDPGASFTPGDDTTVVAQWKAQTWNLRVQGIQVTGDNYTDVMEDGTAEKPASVTYDPETNTLTLTDATIELVGIDNTTVEAGIRIALRDAYYKQHPLNIVLVGENKIINSDLNKAKRQQHGIISVDGSNADIVFSGKGSLEISYAASTNQHQYWGIYSRSNTTFDGVAVNIDLPGAYEARGQETNGAYDVILKNGASLSISTGGHSESAGMITNNKKNPNLSVEPGSSLEVASEKAAFRSVHITEDTAALGALVGKEASADTARVWDGETDLNGTNEITYRYIKIPYSVDKTALEEAVAAAGEDFNDPDVAVSEDGKDLPDGATYVTPKDKEDLETAIGEAQAVLDDPSAPQPEVDTAAAAVKAAADTYDAAKQTAVVDKSALNDAIAAAQKTAKSVTVSKDGKDIVNGEQYITPADKKALDDAVAAAQEVAEKGDASQNDVDAAMAAVETAKADFEAAVRTAAVDKDALEKAFQAANEAQFDVVTSTDGSDVPVTDQWTTEAEEKALDDVIAAVRAVLKNDKVTQNDVDDALARVKAATDKYNKAKKAGKMADPDAGNDPNRKGTDGTPVGPGASAKAADKAITSMKSDADPKGSRFAPLKVRSPKQGKKYVKLTWTKAPKAKRYVVYGNACGVKNKMKKITTVKTNSLNVKKIAKGKKLKKGTYYKFIVVALDSSNCVVSTSKVVHVATKGGKVTNPKKVRVKKGGKPVSKVSVKKGKTVRLKSSVTKQARKRKIRKHRAIKYESGNTKVATVTKKGVIRGKKKGSCTVYVYAQNGAYKRVRVTVK